VDDGGRWCRFVQNAVREDAWAECSMKKAEAAHINVGDERPGPILSKRTPRLGSARLQYSLSTELAKREVQSEVTPEFRLQAIRRPPWCTAASYCFALRGHTFPMFPL